MSGLSDAVHYGVQQVKVELRTRLVAPLIAGAIIWGLTALFALAGLVFLYIVADEYLTARLDDSIAAAAIIAAGNIVLAVILLVARSAKARR